MTLFRQRPDLLGRFREGDPAALEEVYRAYVKPITQVVANTLRQNGGQHITWQAIATDLADVVQDVFIRAFAVKTRQRFDGTRDYGPFLRQIAHHTAIDHLRRREWLVTLDAALVAESYEPAPAVDPRERFAGADTEEITRRYVASLEPPLREVHDALYVRCLSQRQAAAALGLGRQVIRSIESKLRNGLRRELARSARGAEPGRRESSPRLVLRNE